MISEYDVVCMFEKTEGTNYKVLAESEAQAVEIALVMLKEKRRDYDSMLNIRTDVSPLSHSKGDES